MSFKDIDLNDIPEVELLEPNLVVEVSIAQATLKRSKKGRPMISVRLSPLNMSADVEHIFDNICFPIEEDPARTVRKMKTRLKAFFDSFHLNFEQDIPQEAEYVILSNLDGSFALSDWVGRTSKIIVGLDTAETGEDRNIVLSYLVEN